MMKSKQSLPSLILMSLLLIGVTGCRATYKRENIKQDVAALAKKDYQTDVEVAEAGDTVGIRAFVPSLVDELVSSGRQIDNLMMVLSRVALSSDHPPKFIVLDMADKSNPKLHLIFTQYVGDIHKIMVESISRGQYLDRTLIEFVSGNKRTLFDPVEMDPVMLMMLASDSNPSESAVKPFELTDINLQEFLQKVSDNTLRRIIRENKPFKNDFVLRKVVSSFQPSGQFRVLLDIAAKPAVESAGPIIETTLLPRVASEISHLFKSYKFNQFSQIVVVEQNSGKLFTVPR